MVGFDLAKSLRYFKLICARESFSFQILDRSESQSSFSPHTRPLVRAPPLAREAQSALDARSVHGVFGAILFEIELLLAAMG